MADTLKSISLYGKPLFSWVDMEASQVNEVDLPSEACFAYIMEGEPQTVSEKPFVRIEAGQVILSLCGFTVSRMLSLHEPGNLKTLVVHFHREVLRKIYEHEPPPQWKELESPVVQYLVQVSANTLIKQYFLSISHFFDHPEAVTEDLLILKLKEVIVLLLQTRESENVLQIIRNLFSEKAFSFREVVEAHICEPVSVEDLAMLTNHSLSSFKREFRKVFDSTPADYLVRRRTEMVAQKLHMSNEDISQIGYDCGFNSPAHLSRAFKARFGMSPTQYRLNLSVKKTDLSVK